MVGSKHLLGLLLALPAILVPSLAIAAPPASDTLLPSSTKVYVSVPRPQELADHWNATQIGQLLADPVMEPFLDALRQQVSDRWQETHAEIGIKFDDLRDVPTGEVALGLIFEAGGRSALVLLADVTGNEAAAQDLLTRIKAELLKTQGAKHSQQKMAGATAEVFDLPDQDDPGRRIQVGQVIHDGLLIVSNRVTEIEALLKRWQAGAQADRLVDLKAFTATMQRCAADAGDLPPDLRWFVDPLGAADAAQASSDKPMHGEKNMIASLRKVGFDALQGAGGYVNLAVDQYDILHRSFVYAPKPWEQSMNMLALLNSKATPPPAWVPADLATYVSANVDVLTAFDHFAPLFDELFGEGEEGVWDEVLDSLKSDPNGPQIDLRNDLIAHLQTQITVVGDYRLPISPTSERNCIAIEVSDPEQLAETIRKSMEPDPTVVRRDVAGAVIWEIVEESEGGPGPASDVPGAPPRASLAPVPNPAPPVPLAGDEERPLPRSAITVAYGHLFVASHVDLLQEILQKAAVNPRPLATALDYQYVWEELEKLGADEVSIRAFIRTDEALRPIYETFRAGQLPQSESMIAKLLNNMLGDGGEGTLREPLVDASELPDYQVVRRYLGPAGIYVRSEDDGLWIAGFFLRKAEE